MYDRVSTRYLLIYILCITCLCGIGFAGLRNHPWSYDDFDHIEKAKNAQENITSIFTPEKTALRLRFVLSFYFYAVYKVFGADPTGYHILNILFHVLNSLLCARLLLTLFSCPKLAALGGFLFAINTTHYEAIYWVAASATLLGTGFAMISVLFFVKYLTSNRKIHLIVASFAYAATIFSYESLGVIFAIIFLLWLQHKSKPRFKDFTVLWILVTILPYTLWDNYSYFPRYWYCPAIGGSAVLAVFLLWFFSIIPLNSRIKFACFSLIIICLTIFSLRKMEIYEGYYLWHDANFYDHHKNDPKTAITYYERVLSEYDLKFSLLTNNLGIAYQRVGDLDKALQMHHETIQIDPSYDKGILNYAYVLSLQNRISESIRAYSSVVKKNPSMFLIYGKAVSHFMNVAILTQLFSFFTWL